MSADVQLRDRLKAVRDELQAKRAEKVDARKERDAAKDAFASADFSDNGDQAITQTSEFLAAEDAVRKLGEIEDAINDLQKAETGILRMLDGTTASPNMPANGNGPSDKPAFIGWNGPRMLADSSDYQEARTRGVFSSSSRFGVVNIGEVSDRDTFAAAIPTAPGAVVTTDQGAVRPDVRGIMPPGLLPLTILDLIPTGTTDSNIIQYVQVTGVPGSAAETAEGSQKPQEGIGFADATAPVRTVAGWIKLNRQALDDMAGLGTLVNTLLPYDVRRRLIVQMLSGDGTGQNLLGILNTTGIGAPASASGDNVADGILRAMTTIVLSDRDPSFVAMNPLTWQNLLIMKSTGSGEYLYGMPAMAGPQTVWGMRLTANRAVPQATPLVGDAAGATLLVREGVNVKTSDNDQDDFIRNRVTVLAECRVAFPVWYPVSFAKAPLG